MRRRLVTARAGAAATALVAVALCAFAFAFWIEATYIDTGTPLQLGVDAITILPFVAVGALLVWKQPRKLTGWLLATCGVGLALTTAVNAYVDVALGVPTASLPADVRLTLIGNPLSTVAAGFGLVLLPLLFPDGTPSSPRWRWAVRVAAVAMVAAVITAPFAETSLRVYVGDTTIELGANPFASWPGAFILEAVAIAAFIALLLLIPVALASLVARYRRGTVVERLQIRWVVSAAGVFVGVFVVLLVSEFVFGLGLPPLVWDALFGAAVALIPAAIGLAVLRYRLYDIDRLLSRTVSYAVISLVLVGVYVAGVIGLGTTLRIVTGEAGGELVVAASTLAVAAVFQPVRSRVQGLIDRRFNRSSYDAMVIVERFVQRLRDEVDIEVLGSELRETTERALRPAHVSLVMTARG